MSTTGNTLQCDHCKHIFKAALWIEHCPKCHRHSFRPVPDETEIPEEGKQVEVPLVTFCEKYRTRDADALKDVQLITAVNPPRMSTEELNEVVFYEDIDMENRKSKLNDMEVPLVIDMESMPRDKHFSKEEVTLVTSVPIAQQKRNTSDNSLAPKEERATIDEPTHALPNEANEVTTNVEADVPSSTSHTNLDQTPKLVTDPPVSRFSRRSRTTELSEDVTSTDDAPVSRFSRRSRTTELSEDVTSTDDAPVSRFSRRSRTTELSEDVTSTDDAPVSRFSRRSRTTELSEDVTSADDAPVSRFSRRRRNPEE